VSGYDDLTTINCHRPGPGILVAALSRPEQLNAIDAAMIDDFDTLCRRLEKDDSVRVLVITGQGRGFCSGADLAAVGLHKDSGAFADPESFLRQVQERFGAITVKLRRITQPVIAAVNGPAAGGGFAIALAADIRIAAPEAYFVASFINIGLSAGELGVSFLLPRLVGLSRAAEILFTGRKLVAAEAERIGLVSRVVPQEQLMDSALELARVLLSKTIGGLKHTKKVLDANLTAPSLEAAIDLENRNQTMLVFSGEFFKLIEPFVKP